MAAASTVSWPGAISTPLSPSRMSSRTPPAQSVAITGKPAAMASHTALGNPSYAELGTNRLACAR